MARSSLNSRPLRQLTLLLPAAAEEIGCELMKTVTGEHPVVYIDEETRAARLTVYSRLDRDKLRCQQRNLRRLLREQRPDDRRWDPCELRLTLVREADWAEAWKHHFPPFEVGSRLLVKPSWSRRRARRGQEELVLDPGLSFGTGHHPTTRFCLKEICTCLNLGRKDGVLDIGTGSGILAIAAAKLGCEAVIAIDNDPGCVRIAKANARVNGVESRIQIRMRNVQKLPSCRREGFGIICANLTADLIEANLSGIAKVLHPRGRLFLAGILHRQFDSVQNVCRENGLQLLRQKRVGEWQSGVFRFREQRGAMEKVA